VEKAKLMTKRQAIEILEGRLSKVYRVLQKEPINSKITHGYLVERDTLLKSLKIIRRIK